MKALLLALLVSVLIGGCVEDRRDHRPVVIVTSDYVFDGVPEAIEAGTELALRNASDTELHELVAFRIPDDDERSAQQLSRLPPPELRAGLGGDPSLVLLAPPREDGSVVVGDGRLHRPGRYLLVCTIPSGADPDTYLDAATSDGPPGVDGGPPHSARGMVAELIVH